MHLRRVRLVSGGFPGPARDFSLHRDRRPDRLSSSNASFLLSQSYDPRSGRDAQWAGLMEETTNGFVLFRRAREVTASRGQGQAPAQATLTLPAGQEPPGRGAGARRSALSLCLAAAAGRAVYQLESRATAGLG